MKKNLFFLFSVAFLFGFVHLVNAQDLPENWASTDIGNATGGSATYDSENTRMTLAGNGLNFWDTDDAHFAYVKIDGDFEFEARVVSFASESGLGGAAKAGINVRNGLETDAPSMMMAWEDWGGLATTARKAAAETPTWAGGTFPGADAIPWYLKVTRVGDVFYTFESVDKSEWVSVDTLDYSNMLSIVYAGLAISPNSEETATAAFDSINITGNIVSGQTGIRAQMNFTNNREIYPNPAHDHLYVNLTQEEQITHLSVIDVTGSVVFRSSDAFNYNAINVTALQPGLYFLNVVTNKATTTSKFIKK